MEQPLTTNHGGERDSDAMEAGKLGGGNTNQPPPQHAPSFAAPAGPFGFQWTVGAALKNAWKCLTTNACTTFYLSMIFIVGFVFEILMILARTRILRASAQNGMVPFGIAFGALIVAGIGVLGAACTGVFALHGWISLYFNHSRREDTSYKAVTSGLNAELFIKLLLGIVMVNLCLNFAFWFFIIPGIILSVYWAFWFIVVIARHGRSYDGTCAWANALSESMKIVGVLGCCKLFGTLIAVFFIEVLMSLTVVGAFFIIPFHMNVLTELYMVATGSRREEGPTNDAPMAV
jgi:hypothetical protein